MPLLTSFLASAPGTTTLNATQVLQEILQDCLEKFLHYKTSALPGLSPVHAPPPCGLCRCSRPFLPVLRRYNKPERNPGDLAVQKFKTASRTFALQDLRQSSRIRGRSAATQQRAQALHRRWQLWRAGGRKARGGWLLKKTFAAPAFSPKKQSLREKKQQ